MSYQDPDDVLYWREDRGRFYADLRKWLGGGQESTGCTDREEARAWVEDRLTELRARGPEGDTTISQYLDRYLTHKEVVQDSAQKTMTEHERTIKRLVQFLKEVRNIDNPTLSDVDVPVINDYVHWRLGQAGYGGTNIKASTVNTELWKISAFFSFAKSEGKVSTNPVSEMSHKPKGDNSEADYLTVGEATRILRAAKEMQEQQGSRCYPYLYELVATFLLTGGRRQEVFGLQWGEVEMENDRLWFVPNRHRGLKNRKSERPVPIWPQLKDILEKHSEQIDIADDKLVFPSSTGGMLTDVYSALATASERAGLDVKATPHTFRHTYTATRMQTTEGRSAVSPYTVARELGHSNLRQIEQTYGHLQKDRVRKPHVEYKDPEAEVLEG